MLEDGPNGCPDCGAEEPRALRTLGLAASTMGRCVGTVTAARSDPRYLGLRDRSARDAFADKTVRLAHRVSTSMRCNLLIIPRMIGRASWQKMDPRGLCVAPEECSHGTVDVVADRASQTRTAADFDGNPKPVDVETPRGVMPMSLPGVN